MSEIEDKYIHLGGSNSFLGHPTRYEMQCDDGVGRYRHFKNGSILWHPATGVHEIHGAIRNVYAKEFRRLGYPISDERRVSDDEIDELAHLALDPSEEQKENLIHLRSKGRDRAAFPADHWLQFAAPRQFGDVPAEKRERRLLCFLAGATLFSSSPS